MHSRFCAAAQDHCIFTVCRDIAKLEGSKLDFDPGGFSTFFCPPEGRAADGSPPPRRPRGRLGRPWRRPLLRGPRARITAYLQWILSTGASQEGPLKIGLGASAEIRRSRITAYLQGIVLTQRCREQNHCIFTASREKVSRSRGRSEDTNWKNDIDTFFWALHIYSGS